MVDGKDETKFILNGERLCFFQKISRILHLFLKAAGHQLSCGVKSFVYFLIVATLKYRRKWIVIWKDW